MYQNWLIRLAGCVAIFMFMGCTTGRVEYDRMTGTQYPQPETVSGETVNLQTIYWLIRTWRLHIPLLSSSD